MLSETRDEQSRGRDEGTVSSLSLSLACCPLVHVHFVKSVELSQL